MTHFLAKTLGIEAVSNLDFMSRPGIYWRWGGRVFNGMVFGSFLDATNCFFSGGFHDFGHCIDFILRGKSSRITADGLVFKQKYAEYVPYFDLWDGTPVTSQMTRNEARAFAFEAYFQIKEMGFSVIRVGGDEEAQLRASGLLKHIPEQSIDECGLKARILKKCTLQEFAHDKRDLHNFAWPDSRVFLEDAGSDVDALPSRECKVAWQNAFEQAILDEYAVISSAFMESKVRLAIDELGALIRGFQAAEGFVPDHRCIGARLSAKNQLLNKEQHHA